MQKQGEKWLSSGRGEAVKALTEVYYGQKQLETLEPSQGRGGMVDSTQNARDHSSRIKHEEGESEPREG